MESWKLTDINYEYDKYYVNTKKPTYQPIIPIIYSRQASDFLIKGNKELCKIKNKGFNKIQELATNLDSILVEITSKKQLNSQNKIKQFASETLRWLSNYLEEYIPEGTKTVLIKVRNILKSIVKFIDEIAKEGQKT